MTIPADRVPQELQHVTSRASQHDIFIIFEWKGEQHVNGMCPLQKQFLTIFLTNLHLEVLYSIAVVVLYIASASIYTQIKSGYVVFCIYHL